MQSGPDLHLRIALVFPFGKLDSVPSLVNAANLLADAGYTVDIYTIVEPGFLPPQFASPRIHLLSLHMPPQSELPGRWRWLPAKLARALYWPLTLLNRNWQTPYRCVIGVDPEGLGFTRQFTRWLDVPVAYYSLELLFAHELVTDAQRALKALEVSLSRQAALVIVQDPERGGQLRRENGLAEDKLVYVPNAPLGAASRQRSNYLRASLGIAPDKRIVLLAGTLGKWMGTEVLLAATHTWPDEWVLVCHTRQQFNKGEREYYLSLGKPSQVYITTEPVPDPVYRQIVQSADVGVVFYHRQPPGAGAIYLQDNIEYIGLSSGKLAYLLQAGVPVLLSPQPALRRLAETYGCGLVVADMAELNPAISALLAEYDQYSANAVRCFNQELDFARAFQAVFGALGQLKPAPRLSLGRGLRPAQRQTPA